MTSTSHLSRAHPSTSSGPLPFAPTLESRPVSQTYRPRTSLTTPLSSNPPPPLNLAPNPASTNMGRRVPYAGAEHTLGPQFSEEEDGDDSEWLASKMAVLGLDPQGMPYNGKFAANATRHDSHMRARTNAHAHAQAQAQVQAQAQAQAQHDLRVQQHIQMQQLHQQQFAQYQIQQQQLVQAIAFAQRIGQPTEHYREALATVRTQQAALINYNKQAQSLLETQTQRAILEAQLRQARPASYHERQHASNASADQRSAIAAQMQANLLSRNTRPRSTQRQLDEADVRARFESAPNTVASSYTTPQTTSKPVFDSVKSPMSDWRSPRQTSPHPATPAAEPPIRTAPILPGRFTTPQGDSLSAFLSRRRATDESSHSSESEVASISTGTTMNMSRNDTAQTSPDPSMYENDKVFAQSSLGMGRPAHLLPQDRASTAPNKGAPKTATAFTPRSASLAAEKAKSLVLRQPYGPPGEVSELGAKNFQSQMRRQAGINLGMLGRRTETPASTPLLG